MRFRLKLFHKLFAFGAFGVLASAVCLDFIFIRQARDIHVSELRLRGNMLAENMAAGAVSGVETENVFRTLDPMLAVVARQESVAYARIFDAKGKLLAAAGREPAAAAKETMVVRKTIESARGIASLEEGLESLPSSSGPRKIGTVEIDISLDVFEARMKKIEFFFFLVTCLILACGFALSWVLGRRLTRPIRLLIDLTRRLSAGELGVGIPLIGDDELGELAKSFNAMSVDLARTTISKEFLDVVLENIQDALLVADFDGRITLVNPAALRLLGCASAELIGRPASELFDSQDAIFSGAQREKLAREGALHDLSASLVAKTGEKTPVLVSGAVLRAKDGAVTGFIATAKDMSGVRKLEARMRQSEKLSAVGQLAAGVAHEINNPLAVILGFAQGMARECPPGGPLELPITSIVREAVRCKSLVQDLLTFARTSRSDREAMDFNQVVAQAATIIEAQAKLTQVQFRVELGAGLPLILGNQGQIQQVIMNLAKNALDATPAGGALSIRTELLAGTPRSWVCLKVEDTGAGIPEALLSKIFEPFFTTKPVGQGTGLGLSLISEIIAKHSGDVEVESRPGRTVFTVRFPARGGQALDPAEARQRL